jgi:hypothetical protein
MKALFLSLWVCGTSLASETALTTVDQPLEGFGSGEIQLVRVACKDHHASSGLSGAGLITTANLAPANGPEGASDINLASIAGIKFSYFETSPTQPGFKIDCSAAVKEPNGRELVEVFRAALECLRLTETATLSKAELRFVFQPEANDLKQIADEFLKHDKTKPFFKSGE